ncbi:MAG: aminopeptidase P family protein [Candidatus Thermoplasmatota archaeon]|nr:aminopeptidase P family protein [Candidatus Thermoplasmatota archaeon]
MNKIQQLREVMKKEGFDCLAIVPGPNLFYITSVNFHLSERPVVLFIEEDNLTFILPELEIQKLSGLDVISLTYSDVSGPQSAFDIFLKDKNFEKVGVESRLIRHLELNLIDTNHSEIVDSMFLFANLRTVKSDYEIQMVEKAVEIAEKSFNLIAHKLNSGISEKEFASQLVIELLSNGSESELPFSPIVASGANAANPHHFPSDKVIEENELVIVDWGANNKGYFSDITRTFATGKNIDSRLLDAYESVRLANIAAREKSEDGVTAGEVDLAARSIIDQKGFGEYFIHRTGHGLGLEIHEEPNIKQNDDFVLKNGNLFTVEPGIYIPKLGGIRIEDDVLIESGKSRSLTTLSRDLVYL